MNFAEFANKIKAIRGEHSEIDNPDIPVIAKYGDNGNARLVMNIQEIEWDDRRNSLVVVVY